MADAYLPTPLGHLARVEIPVCVALNRLSRVRFVRRAFAAVSRIGDGTAWYVLAGALLLCHGRSALPTVLLMLLAGGSCLVVYTLLKENTGRLRPFMVRDDILLSVPPIDRYSFPSGHTMHAVSFTIVVSAAYPHLVWVLVPFTVLVAASRLVLGLHYPSDVLAGATLGAAAGGLWLLAA